MFSNSIDSHVFTSNDYYIDNKGDISKNIKCNAIDSRQYDKNNNDNFSHNHNNYDNYYNSMKNEYDQNFQENSDKINYGSSYHSVNIKNTDYPYRNDESYNIYRMVNNSSKKDLNTNCNSNFQENELEKNYINSNFSHENKISAVDSYKSNTLSDKFSKSTVNKQNDSFNYNSELKYYRDVVDKMHNEINSLNNKLNELDKTNSLTMSDANKPYKISNFTGVTPNYDLNTEYNTYNPRRYTDTNNRPHSDNNLNEIKLNYNYYTDSSPKTIETTYDENTVDNLINNTPLNYNAYQYGSINIDNIPNNSEKSSKNFPKKASTELKEKTSIKEKPVKLNNNKIKSNSDSNVINRANNFKKNNSRTISNDTKNISKENKRKITSVSKQSKQIPLSNQKIKEKKLKSVSKANSEEISEIIKQNRNLNNQIKFLEKKLDDVNEQIKLDQIEKRGKDYLRIELEKWKFKTEALSKNYILTLNSMKKEISDDKILFVDKINQMESEYKDEIESIKNKYQGLFERQENKIKQYKKENEILKKKLSKVKEILI